MKMIVTVKQVPDTQHIVGNAMKPDGTVNRKALPAIVNPEDLNALEAALEIKEKLGGTVTVISMGPPAAAQALRECYFRGADDVILLSDLRFAVADTLATSFAIKCAINSIKDYDIVLCGRQAIDGDTAQVGPQIAEKLKINQLTNIVKIQDVSESSITVKRATDHGYEILRSRFPVLLTITGEVNIPRSPSVKRLLAFKNMSFKNKNSKDKVTDLAPEYQSESDHFQVWDMDSIGAEESECGLAGSPTKVKKIENVVLTATDIKLIPNTEDGINGLIHELRQEHIIG